MKKTRRLAAWTMALVLSCGMLGGCSSGSGGTTAASAQGETTASAAVQGGTTAEAVAGTTDASNQTAAVPQNAGTAELPELPADGPAVNLIVAYSGTSETTSGKSAASFKQLVEEKSGGKITVTNYDNNQLGSETEVMEGVQTGNITMTIVATSPQVTFIPELAVFDLPNALTDLDAAYTVLNSGEFASNISAAYEKAGFRLLGITPTAFRQMSSNQPVNKLEDFKGIRMRTLENKYHMAYWEALGASPTPVAFTELYMGLQQGLVDAQENPLNSIISTKLYEQQKYIIKTSHIMFIYCYVMNGAFFDNLPAEYQEFLQAAMSEVTSQVLVQSKADEEEAEEFLKENGLEIIEVSDELHNQMVEAAQSVYQMVREDVGDELVDALLDGMQEAKK